MGSLSDFAENELLDHIFNAAYTAPSTVYVALSTADPLDTGAGLSEPVGNGYAREAITFGAAATRRVTQNVEVVFNEATGAWGTITHWALMDALSGGNMLAHGALDSSIAPVSGNTPRIASAEIYVQINASTGGAGFTTYTVHSLLDLMFRNQAFAKPATYIAIATAVLDDADEDTATDMTEENGTDYLRKIVNINGGASPTWSLASGGALSNLAEILMIDSGDWTTDDWDTMTSCAIVTTVSGAAKILGYDNNNITDQRPRFGDIVRFNTGDFDVSLA